MRGGRAVGDGHGEGHFEAGTRVVRTIFRNIPGLFVLRFAEGLHRLRIGNDGEALDFLNCTFCFKKLIIMKKKFRF